VCAEPPWLPSIHRHDMKARYPGDGTGDSLHVGPMAWLFLLLAGLLEVIWVLGLNYSHGFTRFWPSVVTVVSIMLSFALLGMSLRSVPFGTAYAVWTGIGAAGAALIGIFLFGESANAARVGCLLLIVAGTIGLRLATPT
jgi:quaternary ammonium compound-resistance protein SugE